MNFRKAWKAMLEGKKVRRPFWAGYWAWECGTIMIHERDGSVLDIRSTQHVAYTFDNIASKDWEIVKEEEGKTQLSDESTTSDEENATSVEIDVITNIEVIMPCMPARIPHDPDVWEKFWKEQYLFRKDAPEAPGEKTSEAIEKLNTYESPQKDDEIKVGDELENGVATVIVTHINLKDRTFDGVGVSNRDRLGTYTGRPLKGWQKNGKSHEIYANAHQSDLALKGGAE